MTRTDDWESAETWQVHTLSGGFVVSAKVRSNWYAS
jgi:hypothetical protein